MRRCTLLLVLIAVLGAVIACRQDEPGGTESPRRPPARRIVSLVPAATEILFAIGAGSEVVAVSSFDHFPPEVARLPKVGALLDPDLERIIALHPDLAIVFEGQQELSDKLKAAGVAVFAYPRPTIAGIIGAIQSLGRLTRRVDDAKREAATIERQLQDVRNSVGGRPRPRTMVVIGREPGTLRNIYVSGGVGFLAELLDVAGGTNVFADLKRENLQATSETILAAQPDVIVEVVAAQPWTQAEIDREVRVWDALGALPAVRNHRVYLLVGDEFVIPGPRIPLAAQKLAAVLHGGQR